MQNTLSSFIPFLWPCGAYLRRSDSSLQTYQNCLAWIVSSRRKIKLKCTQWAAITAIVINVTCSNLYIDTTYMTDFTGKHILKCNFILFGKNRGRGSNLRLYDVMVWYVMRTIVRSVGLCRVQMNIFYLKPCQLLADCDSKNYSNLYCEIFAATDNPKTRWAAWVSKGFYIAGAGCFREKMWISPYTLTHLFII